MSITAGDKLGPYDIVAPIGAGGMGEVYRATDTKLGRDVALKVLPPNMASDPDRLARFQREARAVAALNHPNVVTLYSVEQCEGTHFLTMELIEGQPLDRLISASGLPADRIIEIAGGIAEALAAAHDKGIVHRDLKPANVMVTNEGRVKVLDFGLAKDTGARAEDDATLTAAGHTQAGMVMGTPAYMSPEQLSARPLDHRTDIFSFGVVLYEMSTGRRPFGGTSSAELVSAILRDTPPPVTDFRADLPGDLARIIRRCLEKDPRRRMQTARDVSNEFRDLAQLGTRTGSISLPASKATAAIDSGADRADEGFWVAVLPFKYTGSASDLNTLADGLGEEINTGLSRFSYLRVIARGSTAKYLSESGDVRAIGKELGARYVLEGSIRQAGNKLRLTVQLVDTVSGTHLWAENYERTFNAEAAFELQDDLAPRIVSTVADAYGVLTRAMSQVVRSRDSTGLTPYEAVLRSFAYLERVTAEEHARTKAALEQALQRAPGSSDCWAMLSILLADEFIHGFSPAADSLERAVQAARRAVDLGSTNHKAYQALAWALFACKEFRPSRAAAERAIALNPMDASAAGHLGQTIAYSGDWQRGCGLIARAMELNPNYPGWFWYAPFLNAYRQDDYQGALDIAFKMNLPGVPLALVALAAAHGQLRQLVPARIAVRELLALKPDYASVARTELGTLWDSQLVEHLIDGLRKAGLEISDAAPAPALPSGSVVVPTSSGAARASEGFWVAVLPFKASGSSADLKALGEGLSEEIVTGLSRFSYLRVIARGSTLNYANRAIDLRVAGGELGARYVIDGTLRQAGAKLRFAVQLIDAVTGANLWADTYERNFSPEVIFELQDDLVPRIVSTVADLYGVLPHSMSESIRSKADDQLTPQEAVIRSFGYHERLTPDEHAHVRRILEDAVYRAPDLSDAWAMLSWIYWDERAHGFNVRPDPLGRALAAARRAIDAAPSNHLAHLALAITLFFQKDFLASRPAAQRALKLNSMDGSALAWMGILTAYAGDWEDGCAHALSAMRLNPNHPGWYWFPLAYNAYRTGDYHGALGFALKINMPGYFFTHLITAAAYGQLGIEKAAQKALNELLALRPDIGKAAREDLGIWFQPDHVEHVLQGLRKAGLEIADEETKA